VKRIFKVGFMFLILVLGFTGCRTSNILNVPQQTIVAPDTKKEMTQDDVFKAIARAAGGLGWIVQKQSDGVVQATLNIRDHQAVALINYSATDYSIQYKSSVNLNYDASEQTIHSNYNGWIQNLDNAIKLQISLL
jgi:predicted small lipoprotein YifL